MSKLKKDLLLSNSKIISHLQKDDSFMLTDNILFNEFNTKDIYSLKKYAILSVCGPKEIYDDFTGISLHMYDGNNKKHLIKAEHFIYMIEV